MSVIVAGHLGAEDMLARYGSNGEYDRDSDQSHFLSYQLIRLWDHQVWVNKSRKSALIRPVNTEKGDTLATVHGINAPLLLASKGDATFVVGGQCYLEDAMFGEVVTWNQDDAHVLPLS